MKPSFRRVLLLAASVLPFAMALPAQALNWLNQGFSPGIAGFNPHETTISPSDVQNLKLTWQSSTTDINGVYSMVEDNGTVFALSQDQNGTGDVVALNGGTGAELWKASLNSSLSTWNYNQDGLAAGSGLVFTPCIQSSEGVCGFSQKTGALVWFDSFYIQGQSDGGPIPRVTYAGGVLYLAENMCDVHQSCNVFWALNAKTGSAIWDVPFPDSGVVDPDITQLSPAVSAKSGLVYVPCGYDFNNNNSVFSGVCTFSLSSGAAGWQYGQVTNLPSPSPFPANSVSVSGNTAFFVQGDENSNQDALTALNASNGTALWTFSTVFSFGDRVQPSIAKGAVYWPDGNGTLWSLNRTTGATRWSNTNWGQFCSPVAGAESQPQVADGVVFITTGCQNGGSRYVTTFALDTKSGSTLWSDGEGFNTIPIVSSGGAPMIVSGTLYTDCVQVCAYNLAVPIKHKK